MIVYSPMDYLFSCSQLFGLALLGSFFCETDCELFFCIVYYGHGTAGQALSCVLFLSKTQGGVSVLLIRKFREALKIFFSVGAVVSRVGFFFSGKSRDRLFLLMEKKKKIKTFFVVVNGCVSARDCLLY